LLYLRIFLIPHNCKRRPIFLLLLISNTHIRKTMRHRTLKGAVCDRRSFLGCSEKHEVAKQLLHPKRMPFNFSDIIIVLMIPKRELCSLREGGKNPNRFIDNLEFPEFNNARFFPALMAFNLFYCLKEIWENHQACLIR
jgi:hypothetical protein